MPEGDTLYRTARTLHQALAGDVVTRFETAYAHLQRVHDQQPLTGRTVEAVTSRGKHLLMALSGDLLLRTHLRMSGSWHLCRVGEGWHRSPAQMRILLATEKFQAVAFNVQDAEFLARADLARNVTGQLGPDLLGASFDEAEALRRVRTRPDDPIATAVLNQRLVAGIGNIYKSETLFLCGLHPDLPVRAISDERLLEVFRVGRRLLQLNVRETSGPNIVTYGSGRRTSGIGAPDQATWVYGRAGLACRRCGTRIERAKQGLDARATFWCPTCQPAA